MPKILPQNLSSKERRELLKEFYDFVSSLDRKEAEEFFRDFLTSSEQIILARRLKVGKMLLQGCSSSQVRKELGVGVSTVQFVQTWLKDELKRQRK